MKEEQEEGERVRAERAQFVAQLQEMREQLRTESQAREEAERRAKQEVTKWRGLDVCCSYTYTYVYFQYIMPD